MKKYISFIILIMLLCSIDTFAIANDEVTLFDGRGKATAYIDLEDEVTLFDGRGKATAYIDLEDEVTIYLWSGKPVAYLKRDSAGGFHVYGFNGKHLGWFVDGVIWGHDGNASCAVEEKLKTTEFEPFKSFKQFKPFKSFEEFAPFRPFFTNSFGDTPCRYLLAEGGK